MNDEHVDVLIETLTLHRGHFLKRIAELLSPHLRQILQADDALSHFRVEALNREQILGLAFDSEDLLEACRLV